MSTCAKCQRVHCSVDVVALDRFRGVTGYRTPDGLVHSTRDEGQNWLCTRHAAERRQCACGLTDPEMPCYDCRFRGVG